MYSTAIRQMMVFLLHLKRTCIRYPLEFVSMNTRYRWDGCNCLSIYTSTSEVKLTIGLGTHSGRNFISTNSRRLNIRCNNYNFNTFLSPELTVLTADMLSDEGVYFQHMVVAELPDYEEVLGVYEVSNELVENNVSYFGTYCIPVLDMGHVARQLEYKYPQSKGYWGRYLK